MSNISITTYQSPFGELILGSFESKICLCDWKHRNKRTTIDKRLSSSLEAEMVDHSTPLHNLARRQLDEYFQGERNAFALPLFFVGTGFQKRVWNALRLIPYGQTASYQEIAGTIGDKEAVRAVAAANGANALALLIPCHRIVGHNGSLVGYAGGIRVKQKLLELEQNGQQTELF